MLKHQTNIGWLFCGGNSGGVKKLESDSTKALELIYIIKLKLQNEKMSYSIMVMKAPSLISCSNVYPAFTSTTYLAG